MSESGPVAPVVTGPSLFRRRAFRITLGVILVLGVATVWALTALQKFITFPRAHPSVQQPGARVAAGGEDIWFDINGARVEAWFLPAAGIAAAPLVIHAHGNGELIDIQTKSVAALRGAGVGVLLVEYPGYGRSMGEPSENTVTQTFVAAHDWATGDARVDAARIIGYGRSLGGGAIMQLAARRKLAAIVLESTFTSIGELVRNAGVPGWLVVNQFDSRTVLAKYRGPVLIMHGTQDGTFPVALAHALHEASPQSVLHITACGHNDCPLQWELVLGFLRQNGVFTKPGSGDSS